jgi:CRP-like cAMP-binding protein/rhodanese-related sulfurtransferase
MDGSTDGLRVMRLARLEPISSLMEEQIVELAGQTEELELSPGECLFQEGDEGNDLIYLIEGEVEIKPANGEPYIVKSGTPESRHVLEEHTPRRCTVNALTPVIFFRIDSDLVDTMLTWAESAASDGEEVILSGDNILNIDTGELKHRMQNSPNFRKVPAANIDLLVEKLQPVRKRAGDVVMRQGDEGDYFYVIEEGEALVTRIVEEDEENEGSVEMAHLDEGATFGEAALISDTPRNATVSMQTDGVLLRLNKEDFLKLMQDPMQNWVSYEEALEKVGNGAVWLDERAAADYHHGHLPGAINIPMNVAHRRAHDLDTSKHYICYCQTGRRSSAAAFILSQYDLEVSVLKGGLQAIEGDVELVTEAS